VVAREAEAREAAIREKWAREAEIEQQ